jgi:hypothetical protein
LAGAPVSERGSESTTHRGVPWRRDGEGHISFYDTDGQRWVAWGPGVDAPPLPPEWGAAGRSSGAAANEPAVRPGRPVRAGWTSRWRLLPLILVIVAVIIAVAQALQSSGTSASKEASAAAALEGRCLVQDGTAGGHPRYSAKPVDCSSPRAAVKVVAVVSSTPGSPFCPAGSTGVTLAYPGVRYPHILCVAPAGTG